MIVVIICDDKKRNTVKRHSVIVLEIYIFLILCSPYLRFPIFVCSLNASTNLDALV